MKCQKGKRVGLKTVERKWVSYYKLGSKRSIQIWTWNKTQYKLVPFHFPKHALKEQHNSLCVHYKSSLLEYPRHFSSRLSILSWALWCLWLSKNSAALEHLSLSLNQHGQQSIYSVRCHPLSPNRHHPGINYKDYPIHIRDELYNSWPFI